MIRIADFGELACPLLLCGGAVGNLEALESLDTEARRLGIDPRHIIHTGDVVAYCADAAAAASFVAERGWRAIKGNVEQQLAAKAEDCACGFAPGTVCDALTARWYAHAERQMTSDLRQWMAGLPDQAVFTVAGHWFRVVHGSAAVINRFMFASLPEAEFSAEFDRTEAECIVAGHTGIPFTRAIGDRLWHNPGSLGMPANDGTPRGWYSILAPVAGGLRLAHHGLVYDHVAAASKMRSAGLPDGYAACLETGLWPSLDALPEAERAVTGNPLPPSVHDWRPPPS